MITDRITRDLWTSLNDRIWRRFQQYSGALTNISTEYLDFCGLSVFRPANGRDVEVRPNWFLLVDTKGKRPRHRLIPMNEPVRAALQKVIDRRTTGKIFDYKQTGVSASTLRSGFEKACERAGIPLA